MSYSFNTLSNRRNEMAKMPYFDRPSGSCAVSEEDKLGQRRKCIVCGALRPADEMYPFSQRPAILSNWCNNLYPSDPKAANRMFLKVARSVSPTLCGEHFDRSCFTSSSKDLKPNAFPTMAKVRTTASVMNILKSAKAKLQKVLPGNFIPRSDMWDKMDRAVSERARKQADQASGASDSITKLLQKAALEMKAEEELTNQRDEEQAKDVGPSTSFTDSPVLFDANQAEVKEENYDVTAFENIKETEEREEEGIRKSPQRETIRSRREPSPMENDTTMARDSSTEGEPVITTRSGRQVKRKILEYEEPESRKRAKKSKVVTAVANTIPSNSATVATVKEQIIGRFVEASTAATNVGHNRAEKANTNNAGPSQLLAPTVTCIICKKDAEASVYGMMEHAREHSEFTLQCPFEDCDFSTDRRSRMSHHTQYVHRRWAFPVDLTETMPAVGDRLRSKMHQCFPSAMERANDPYSVSCAICSYIVSPDYRSLYSHACRHLPSRPYSCSECSTFEAYTEDEIEEHLQDAACRGDIVSKMDDAVASLMEKLFRSAFPSHAHLQEVRSATYDPVFEEIKTQPTEDSAQEDGGVAQHEVKKEEGTAIVDCSVPSEVKKEEESTSRLANHFDHDHQYWS